MKTSDRTIPERELDSDSSGDSEQEFEEIVKERRHRKLQKLQEKINKRRLQQVADQSSSSSDISEGSSDKSKSFGESSLTVQNEELSESTIERLKQLKTISSESSSDFNSDYQIQKEIAEIRKQKQEQKKSTFKVKQVDYTTPPMRVLQNGRYVKVTKEELTKQILNNYQSTKSRDITSTSKFGHKTQIRDIRVQAKAEVQQRPEIDYQTPVNAKRSSQSHSKHGINLELENVGKKASEINPNDSMPNFQSGVRLPEILSPKNRNSSVNKRTLPLKKSIVAGGYSRKKKVLERHNLDSSYSAS